MASFKNDTIRNMETHLEKVTIQFCGHSVQARQLTVTSSLPLSVDAVWQKVLQSHTLEFISRGMITFQPDGGAFPATWEEGMEVKTGMKLYGWIPFGGKHTLKFVRIDEEGYMLQTRESDPVAKVWNHTISLKAENPHQTRYRDEIIIYGGWMTPFISWWSSIYYRHRQKRWMAIAGAMEKAE